VLSYSSDLKEDRKRIGVKNNIYTPRIPTKGSDRQTHTALMVLKKEGKRPFQCGCAHNQPVHHILILYTTVKGIFPPSGATKRKKEIFVKSEDELEKGSSRKNSTMGCTSKPNNFNKIDLPNSMSH
jgi:hypothetical protein